MFPKARLRSAATPLGRLAGPTSPSRSDLRRDTLIMQCRFAGLPPAVAEHKFSPTRKYAIDVSWPELKFAVEIEGIVYAQKPRMLEVADHRLSGRHVSATGFTQDIEKYAEAITLGWTVLRVLPKHVDTGIALGWILDAFKVRGWTA